MKKFVSLALFLCVTLMSGIFLVGCGEKSSYILEVQQNPASNSLYEIVLKENNEILTHTNSRYQINANANIRVEVLATGKGVDFSDFVAKLNGKQKNIIQNTGYSPIPGEGSLVYGYFLIVGLDKDTTISFEGAKIIQQTEFEFSSNLIEDEAEIEKLKMTSINFSDDDETAFVNLYEFLTSDEEKSFSRDFVNGSYNNFNTFKVKFDGVEPFELNATVPFQINNQTAYVDKMTIENGVYTVSIENIEKMANYVINVDFSQINYAQFECEVGEKNKTYEIVVDERYSYDSEGTIQINKLLDSETADYSGMNVYLNDVLLEEIVEENETKTIYKVAKHSTPLKLNGSYFYYVVVDGISYKKETKNIRVSEVSDFADLDFSPAVFTKLESKKQPITGINIDGSYSVFADEVVVLTWNYEYDQVSNGYDKPFDLYDFALYNGETKIFDIKPLLDSKTENVEVTEQDYTFRAILNQTSQIFDTFEIEIVGNGDLDLIFTEFKKAEKQIEVSYNFEDFRVEEVSFRIEPENTIETDFENFEVLQKQTAVSKIVEVGDFVVFRLKTGVETVSISEFQIQQQRNISGWVSSDVYVEEGSNYIQFKYLISNFQTMQIQDLVLIPTLR